jgi:RNA polymerase sigma factor (TIGR02999 family)
MAELSRESTRSPTAQDPGDARAAEVLLPLVYNKLRVLAHRYMRSEEGYHTLQPTALVHEAYVRLSGSSRTEWRGKTHFFAVAATQMRRVLVEHARAARAQKRGSRPTRVTFEDNMAPTLERTVEVIALDEALHRLAKRSPRQCTVCELRLFAGMLVSEIAAVLGVSDKTVKRDWRLARAWLARELATGRSRP